MGEWTLDIVDNSFREKWFSEASCYIFIRKFIRNGVWRWWNRIQEQERYLCIVQKYLHFIHLHRFNYNDVIPNLMVLPSLIHFIIARMGWLFLLKALFKEEKLEKWKLWWDFLLFFSGEFYKKKQNVTLFETYFLFQGFRTQQLVFETLELKVKLKVSPARRTDLQIPFSPVE